MWPRIIYAYLFLIGLYIILGPGPVDKPAPIFLDPARFIIAGIAVVLGAAGLAQSFLASRSATRK